MSKLRYIANVERVVVARSRWDRRGGALDLRPNHSALQRPPARSRTRVRPWDQNDVNAAEGGAHEEGAHEEEEKGGRRCQ